MQHLKIGNNLHPELDLYPLAIYIVGWHTITVLFEVSMLLHCVECSCASVQKFDLNVYTS